MTIRPPSNSSPDVAIVGGGVAGSALAIRLRGLGLEVAIIERSPVFRDRIRGETIHPWGTTEVRSLGLYDLVVDLAKAQPQLMWQTYRDREAQSPYRWADDFPDTPNGLGVSHVALQNALLAETERVGARLYRPASVRFSRDAGTPLLTVTSLAGEVTLRPQLVVGADGEHSPTRTWIGGTMTADPMHHHIGGALIQGLGLASDRIHQAFFESGFVFVSPQADDVARLYLVCNPDESMEIQTSSNPAARVVQRFRDSVPEGFLGERWQSIGPVSFFSNASARAVLPPVNDVVLIGDASGRNDPSQGHGLSLAFHDVRILGEMLEEDSDWTAVPNRFHEVKGAYFETLRQHARWNECQATEVGPEIDEIRDRIARAREFDPTAGGFAAIFATGPDNLEPTEVARRHYFGEDLVYAADN